MAALSPAEVQRVLKRRSLDDENAFDVLAALGRFSCFEDRETARDLLIRVLDQRDRLPESLLPLLQSLIREHGLFPYLSNHETLSLADRLALEAHRPDGDLGVELVFHAEQSMVFDHLMAGENVVLSAPTSFGKSLVVDAYLDARDFTNAVVIVPTIALMDETRRRLRKVARPGGYKIITHSSQMLGEHNLLVMTQERLLEYGDLPPIDFFVVDEFYKLDPSHGDQGRSGESRSSQLNMAFDLLRRTGAQYYLLGPNITALDQVSGDALRATFIHTAFTTVATDVERHHATKDEAPDLLAEECRHAGSGTLVFCSSPDRTRKAAEWLLERGVGYGPDHPVAAGLADATEWVAQTYHPDWIVARALRAGIGIDNGRLPRAPGHHLVRLFNEGRLPYLLVTSTLIEGVNTAARTVIVLDHTIARKKYDYFTFANIRGRSGRMFQHYVGRVVVFNPEPTPADLTVEIPALSQSRQASVEVLLHLPEERLTDGSRARIAPYLEQNQLSVDTLRANRGIKLDAQLAAARTFAANPRRYGGALQWRGAYPTTDQVHVLSELMVEMLGTSGVIRSARQLGTGSIFCAATAATSARSSAKTSRTARQSTRPSMTISTLSATTHSFRSRPRSPRPRPSGATCSAPAQR
jgi:hypothetical protein